MHMSKVAPVARNGAAIAKYLFRCAPFGSFFSTLSCCAVFLLATGLQASMITPDTATASSQFGSGSGYVAMNTINGSGLTGPITPSSTHATYASGNHWTTDGSSPLDEWIEWGFNTPQTLGAIYIWNHRSNGIANNAGYEPTLFDLTLYDAANNPLLTLNDVALLPDVATAQTISFTLTSNVSRVRFDVEQTQSSTNYTGLAEVRFDTTTGGSEVPEPSTVSLIAGGLGLGFLLRRRARR